MNASEPPKHRRDATIDELQRSLTSSRALLDEIIALLSKSPEDEKHEILATAAETKQAIRGQIKRLHEMLDAREDALIHAIDQFASEKIIHADSIRERIVTQSTLIKEHYDILKIIPTHTKAARSSKAKTHIARLNGASSRAKLTIESRRADFGFEELLEASVEDFSAIHEILSNPCQMRARSNTSSAHGKATLELSRDGSNIADLETGDDRQIDGDGDGDGGGDEGGDDAYLYGAESTLTSVSLSNQYDLATDSDGDSTEEHDFDSNLSDRFRDNGTGIHRPFAHCHRTADPNRNQKAVHSLEKEYQTHSHQTSQKSPETHPLGVERATMSHRTIQSSNIQSSRSTQGPVIDTHTVSLSYPHPMEKTRTAKHDSVTIHQHDDNHPGTVPSLEHDPSAHVKIVDWAFHSSRHGSGIQLADASMTAANKSWFGTGFVVGDVVYNKGRFSFDVKINRISSFVAVGFVTSTAVQLDYLHAYTWHSDGVLSDSSGYGTSCPECSFREADVVTIDVDLDQSRANMKNYRTKQSISIDFHLASDLDSHFSPFIDIGSGSSVTLLCRREWP